MRLPILAALLLPLLSGQGQAAVDVSFSQPEAFTDAELGRSYGEAARRRTLEGIERHFNSLAERWLRPEQDLRIEVLDIDLAGRFEPWHAMARDVRAMRDVTWPRIRMRFALAENGKVVETGEEEVTDLDYLLQPEARLSRDPLRYEKAMLEDWFRSRFGEPAGG